MEWKHEDRNPSRESFCTDEQLQRLACKFNKQGQKHLGYLSHLFIYIFVHRLDRSLGMDPIKPTIRELTNALCGNRNRCLNVIQHDNQTNQPDRLYLLSLIHIYRIRYLIHIFNVAVLHCKSVDSGTFAFWSLQNIQFIYDKTDGFVDLTDKVYWTVLLIPLKISVCLTKLSIVNKQNWTKP